MKTINIALLGFGTVGSGVAETIAGQPREPACQRALVEQPIDDQGRRQGEQMALGQPLASIGEGD